jgi:hypothetical protein
MQLASTVAAAAATPAAVLACRPQATSLASTVHAFAGSSSSSWWTNRTHPTHPRVVHLTPLQCHALLACTSPAAQGFYGKDGIPEEDAIKLIHRAYELGV